MAVFLINECKYFGCGLEFQSLGDLIYHIEDTHIETDPAHLEHQESEQPQALAASYILRFYSDADQKYDVQPVSPSSSLKSITPVSWEMDEEDVVSDGYESDEPITNTANPSSPKFTATLIHRMLTKNPGDCDKPFVCPIPGCKKSYKNINGMKYHAKNGHKKDLGFVQKAYKCECGKNYKTLHGLRNHNSNCHSSDHLTMTSMDLVKSNGMLIATQIFAPQPKVKEPAIKHVKLAPNIIRQNTTSCNVTNLLKGVRKEKENSPVFNFNSTVSSEEQVEVEVIDSPFLDEDSHSFIAAEQARLQ